MKLSIKPYYLFFLLAGCSYFAALVSFLGNTYWHWNDRGLNDYIPMLFCILAIFISCCGAAYLLVDKVVYSRRISWWHIWGTMALIVLDLMFERRNRHFHIAYTNDFDYAIALMKAYYLTFLVFLWQLLFPYNVIRGWWQRIRPLFK
ncbi:hypothetical protein CLV59_11232 [Chitinophaga dinghuensis]|uniref:Uncharacterized protein n=1 Tax=Chitinophaga dinghuensis TaxID=1539050 RepID=A0A327VLG2_9BACT|nr:hypothetical protein CLV59_11232 [Chitinophaga dinghuensis]